MRWTEASCCCWSLLVCWCAVVWSLIRVSRFQPSSTLLRPSVSTAMAKKCHPQAGLLSWPKNNGVCVCTKHAFCSLSDSSHPSLTDYSCKHSFKFALSVFAKLAVKILFFLPYFRWPLPVCYRNAGRKWCSHRSPHLSFHATPFSPSLETNTITSEQSGLFPQSFPQSEPSHPCL